MGPEQDPESQPTPQSELASGQDLRSADLPGRVPTADSGLTEGSLSGTVIEASKAIVEQRFSRASQLLELALTKASVPEQRRTIQLRKAQVDLIEGKQGEESVSLQQVPAWKQIQELVPLSPSFAAELGERYLEKNKYNRTFLAALRGAYIALGNPQGVKSVTEFMTELSPLTWHQHLDSNFPVVRSSALRLGSFVGYFYRDFDFVRNVAGRVPRQNARIIGSMGREIAHLAIQRIVIQTSNIDSMSAADSFSRDYFGKLSRYCKKNCIYPMVMGARSIYALIGVAYLETDLYTAICIADSLIERPAQFSSSQDLGKAKFRKLSRHHMEKVERELDHRFQNKDLLSMAIAPLLKGRRDGGNLTQVHNLESLGRKVVHFVAKESAVQAVRQNPEANTKQINELLIKRELFLAGFRSDPMCELLQDIPFPRTKPASYGIGYSLIGALMLDGAAIRAQELADRIVTGGVKKLVKKKKET